MQVGSWKQPQSQGQHGDPKAWSCPVLCQAGGQLSDLLLFLWSGSGAATSPACNAGTLPGGSLRFHRTCPPQAFPAHHLRFGATLPDPRGGWTSQNKLYGVSDPKMSCESLPQFPHSKVSPFSMSTARVTGRQGVIQTCLQNTCPHKGQAQLSLSLLPLCSQEGPCDRFISLALKKLRIEDFISRENKDLGVGIREPLVMSTGCFLETMTLALISHCMLTN